MDEVADATGADFRNHCHHQQRRQQTQRRNILPRTRMLSINVAIADLMVARPWANSTASTLLTYLLTDIQQRWTFWLATPTTNVVNSLSISRALDEYGRRGFILSNIFIVNQTGSKYLRQRGRSQKISLKFALLPLIYCRRHCDDRTTLRTKLLTCIFKIYF